MTMAEGFPLPTFRAQALLRTIKDDDNDATRLVAATETLFETTWGGAGGAEGLATLEGLRALLLPLYTPDSTNTLDALLAKSNSKANKDRMKAEAKHLAEHGGAFGVPWIVVTRPDGTHGSFFGSDRLEVRRTLASPCWRSLAHRLARLELAG